MSHRRAVVVAVTALGLLAGCGGGDDSDDARTPDAPTSTAATTSATSATPTTGASTPPGPTSYLPVPAGRTLTPPGTALKYRDGALVAWEPRQDLVGVVGVEVVRVERTTVKRSLAGFRLPPSSEGATPYFVTSLVGNGGDTDLGGRQLPVYVVDTEGRLVPPTGVDQDFDLCPGSLLPAIFAPGDQARSCLIFLVPQGAELAQVMFRPPEGVVPITWSGKVKKLSDRGKKPKAGRGKPG